MYLCVEDTCCTYVRMLAGYNFGIIMCMYVCISLFQLTKSLLKSNSKCMNNIPRSLNKSTSTPLQ